MKQSFSKRYLSFLFVTISVIGMSPFVFAAVNTSVKQNESVKAEGKKNSVKKEDKIDTIKHRLSADEIEAIKSDAKEIKKRWSVKTPMQSTLSTSKRFERSQKYLTDNNYARALEVIEPVIERPSSNDTERAKALVLKTQILMSMSDYPAAEKAIQEAIKLESLAYAEQTEALLFLAQIQMVDKNYKEAKKNLVTFIEVAEDKAPAAYIMLATIENDMGDIEEAEKNVDAALKDAKKPQEQWLYFASNVYVRNKKFDKAEKILKDLIEQRQNNKNYWMSLVGVLFENDKPGEALRYLEMAQKLGYVDGATDITNRAAMLAQERIPYKAALILQQAVDKKDLEPSQKIYEFMASFWFVAKEYNRSIEAYKKASAMANSGAVDLLLGQVYIEQEDWANAQKAFHTALRKGNLKKQTGNAILGLGMTAYFQDDKVSALKYFSQAQKYKQQKEAAERWISFLN